MYYNKNTGEILNELPKIFGNILNFNKLNKIDQIKHGFFELEIPTYDKATHKLGSIKKNGNKYTYNVIELTATEKIEKQKQQKKQERNNKLQAGIVVNNFWFNEFYLKSFIAEANVQEKLGNTEMEWKDINGNWVVINLSDALNIMKQASDYFKNIYKQY